MLSLISCGPSGPWTATWLLKCFQLHQAMSESSEFSSQRETGQDGLRYTPEDMEKRTSRKLEDGYPTAEPFFFFSEEVDE